jgi:hypothetical protein
MSHQLNPLSPAAIKKAFREKTTVVTMPEPFYDFERDGVTFSVLNGWLQCRESARLSLHGHTGRYSGMATTFGSISHNMLENAYKDIRAGRLKGAPSVDWVKKNLVALEKMWREENPMPDDTTRQHFELTMLLQESLMPLYFQHWANDFKMKWEQVEKEFKIPLTINHPNGHVYKTFLRGKMDGSFVAGRNVLSGPTLLETKTKSRLDEGNLSDILPFELQVNIYLRALLELEKKYPIGVLYNVIRRPGLRVKKNESLPAFAKRISADIRRRPDWYFIRMRMSVEPRDIDRFEGQLVDLVGDFCAWWRGHAGHYRNSSNCENKYGVCWALPICSRGEYAHTFKRDKVFRELVEVM